MRYTQLIDAVRERQPKAILEVGTWNGDRALQMLGACPSAAYYGFDLFEEATAAIDALEMNVKAHHRMEEVADKLDKYDKVSLIPGNTRITLAKFRYAHPFIDFAWIDGGHSIETIESDWRNVQRVLTPDAWVFFDDYYTEGPDTAQHGCNRIVEPLRHEVLPLKDAVRGGGFTQMVRVFWPQ